MLAGLSMGRSTRSLVAKLYRMDPPEPTKLSPGHRVTFHINRVLALSATMRINLVQGSILNSDRMRLPQGGWQRHQESGSQHSNLGRLYLRKIRTDQSKCVSRVLTIVLHRSRCSNALDRPEITCRLRQGPVIQCRGDQMQVDQTMVIWDPSVAEEVISNTLVTRMSFVHLPAPLDGMASMC
jgi:hypothetical protein